jgi:hypothetical protein
MEAKTVSSTREDALANQPILQTTTYGGPGGAAFAVASGAYVSTISFLVSTTLAPHYFSIIVKFNNGTEAKIGGVSSADKRVDVPLDNDSISKVYVRTARTKLWGKEDLVIGDVHLETTRGHIYSTTTAAEGPLAKPKEWSLVKTAGGDPCDNMVLVGIAGRGGEEQTDALAFYYKSDKLLKHGMTNIHYDSIKKSEPKAMNVASATVENRTAEVQQMSISFSKSVASSYTFSTTTGVTAGFSTTIEAGIPFVVGGQVEISASITFEVTMGVAVEITEGFSYEAAVSVNPGETVQANAKASNSSIEADYTAFFSEVWAHAGAVTRQVDGKLRGISAYDVVVDYDRVTEKARLEQAA